MAIFTRKLFLFTLLFLASIGARAVTADFTADNVSGCSPLVVHFTNTSSGDASDSWDLGNGTTSTSTSHGSGAISGSYITPGTYTVTLTATSSTGATSIHTLTITVYPSPIVSFVASDTSICPGTSTTFTSTSTAGVSGAVTYVWSFGDGSSSTVASPTHTYTTPGFYNVTLIVTNSEGCSSTLTVGAFIHVFNHSTPGFYASGTYFCNAPATTTFTNTTTGTGPFTYLWSFGDGSTSTDASPTHTYGGVGTYTVRLYVTDANGCIDSISRAGYVFIGSMTASFTGPTTVCDNSWATFVNTSSTHTSSNWSFGDGGTGTSDTGRHFYSTPGTYTVTLIVHDGPCADTVTSTITVLPMPTISFTMSPAAACPAPATVSFTGSVPAGSTVTWSFGDGATGAGSSTSHTYAGDGRDSVVMTVTDPSGCVATATQFYYIRDLISTIFASTLSGCAPLTVNFSDTLSSSTPTPGSYPYGAASYSWTFGDGGTSTSPMPSHTYTATGVYGVILWVTTTNGCTVRDSTTISVGTVPVVTFTDTPSTICYGRSIGFYAHVTSGGPVSYYFWTWGDGTSSTDSFSSTSHSFARPGTDTVTLIAYNNGCPSAPYHVYPIVIDSPMAIIASAYNCNPYNMVTYGDSSLGDDSHLWIFGDGTTSTADTISHTYPGFTTYTCYLTTYNARSGCRDTTSVTVDLTPPVLHMFASDSFICPEMPIHFSQTVTGSAATGWWWYANGVCVDYDTSANFIDTFTVPGIYSIMLKIRDGHGCFDSVTHTNWITVAKPVDSFTATPPRGCWPLDVTFTDYSTDEPGVSVTRYIWTFGDGTSSTVTSAATTHIYTAAGVYTISEITTDNVGCKDTLVRNALITVSRPHAAFTASTQYPCLGNPVLFTNTSTGGIASSFWMFGDTDTSSVHSPTHTYLANGTYTVKLVVVDTNGCRDTATYTGYIIVSGPDAAFTMSDSFSICPPMSVNFFNASTGATSYFWSFGDGTTSVLVSPGDLYVTSGLYNVMLVATNSHGCHDTVYHQVNLYGYAGAFTYGPDSGCAPLTVTFHAAISNVPNIIWDFADGNTTMASRLDSTVHTYMLPGAYVPKLILSDNTGCRNSSLGLDTIKVDGVIPGFTTLPHPVCVNTNINFRDTSFSYFSTITAWHWLFNNTGDTSDLSSPPYDYTSVGSYVVTLTVKDGWGCVGTTVDTVVVNPPPTITTSPDTIICVGDTGTLRGYGGVSYVWTPAGPLGCPTCQSTSADPTVQTTFTVTGTDANGCKNIDSVTIGMRTLTISRGWGDTEVCDKVPVQLFDTGGTKYTWLPSTGLSDPHVFDPIATPSVTTRYMIIAQYGGCIPDTNYVNLIIDPLPTVDAGPDQNLVAGSLATLHATGTLIDKYRWSPGISLTCDSCESPVASMMSTTTYTVTVTTIHGCTASDTVTIYLFCDKNQVYIPNSFTPNGDGQNDVFYPRGSGISNIKTFRIYNRWGELMFERQNISINDVSNAWDGSYNGSAPHPDVYVYLIDAVCDTGEPIFIKGDVTIIR